MNISDGTPSVFSCALGSAIALSATAVVALNCLIGCALVCNGFFKGPSGSLYTLSFNLIVSDTLHILSHAWYLGPSSALQSWMLPEGWRRVPSVIAVIAWKSILLTLSALAVNR